MDNITYKTTIQNTSQIILEGLVLTSYNGFQVDLIPHMLNFNITESIQNVFLSGYVLLSESLNLIRFTPITGNEKVKATFYTPGAPKIQVELLVSKISRLILDGTKSVTYKLELISPQYILSCSKKISESYANKTYSEMATAIFTRYLQAAGKAISVRETKGKKKIVIPYMSPSDAILFLASRSSDTEDNCNYVFYETLDNKFYFRPLFNVSSTIPVSWEYRTFLPSMSNVSVDQEYTRIRELEIFESSDAIKNRTQGVFASELISTDLTYKKINKVDLSYKEAFDKTKHINPYGILPNFKFFPIDANSHLKVYPKSSYGYDDIEDNDGYESQLLERNFQLLSSDSFKIAINVFGDSRRKVGQFVNVFINAPQAAELTTEKYDPYLSGRYLVYSITHIIKVDQYFMNLLLIKDSNSIPYPDQKVIT